MTPERAPANLAVMLSGSGRTLVNLLEHVRSRGLRARVALAIASKECLGAERARAAGVKTLVMPGDVSPEELLAVLQGESVDLIVLAGYVRLLTIPAAYRGRVLNIHPALLPSFGGPGMYGDRVHQAVLDAGCKVSGCTVHLCDESYDRGPILVQKVCSVLEDDDCRTLAARVFELECLAYPEAIELVLAGRVQVKAGRVRVLPSRSGRATP